MDEIKYASGVIVIDADRDEVLLLQRPSGEWGLPGGKQELGETPAMAAVREVQEETGLVLDPATLVPVRRLFNSDGFAFTCYKVVAPKFEPQLLDGEHVGWGWWPLDQLPQPLFMNTGDLICNTPTAAMDEAVQDVNGWCEYPDNPISRVGVFPYLGSQIDGSLEPDKIYNVYRPAEELGDPATIESFKLVPWIAGHTMLGAAPGGVDAGDVGVSGVIGEKVYFDDGVLYGNLKMFNGEHADLIAGGIKDLSLGYQCSYEYAPGTFDGESYDYVQRNMRGNHLATVRTGRMGPSVAVCDSLTFTLENPKMADEKTQDDVTPATVNTDVDTMTVEQLVELAKPLVAKLKELGALAGLLGDTPAPEVTTEETTTEDEDDEDKKPDVVTEDEDDKPEALTTAEDSMSKVMAAIGRRDTLAKKLVPLVGAFDHAPMTEKQVAAYGCKKLGLTPAAGHEIAALQGYIAATAKTTTKRVAAAMDSAAIGADAAVPAFLKNHV